VSTGSLHLRLWWEAVPATAAPLPSGVEVRALDPLDTPALGRVMWEAFTGTVDDEYPTVANAEIEVRQTLEGKWGPLVTDASLVATIREEIVSAVFVVLDSAHDEAPLLAFVVTLPDHRGLGIGGGLIQTAVESLHASGVRELHLAVLASNPAVRLYQRMGFEIVPPQPDA
jgi:ribosomal protein S18 acetylase RimI-like enzyme